MRVYRIYVKEKLIVRKRKRRRRICAQARVLLSAPVRQNETWTMDFLYDALATGRKLRTLSIEDAYTREMLVIEVDTSLPALRVVRVLEKLRQQRGLPVQIVIDDGTEFTDTVPEILSELAMELTWSNFKNEVARYARSKGESMRRRQCTP